MLRSKVGFQCSFSRVRYPSNTSTNKLTPEPLKLSLVPDRTVTPRTSVTVPSPYPQLFQPAYQTQARPPHEQDPMYYICLVEHLRSNSAAVLAPPTEHSTYDPPSPRCRSSRRSSPSHQAFQIPSFDVELRIRTGEFVRPSGRASPRRIVWGS